MNQGRLFIISAPSGAGKTTLLQKVMPNVLRLVFSVSHTTRAPRPGEWDGISYYFISESAFKEMRDQGAFLEWAEVHGKLYGTSRQAVFAQLETGVDVMLDIDVQGAAIIRNSGLVDASSIFIAPPDLAELERRLRGRDQDSEQTIQLRMKNAIKEMQAMEHYDYLIINGQLEEAAKVLEAIILAERARMHRLPSGLPAYPMAS
ncbi:MAG: guanylate kinase [Desulfosalsimonadaceae bacterium]|nr:guanylate kinase [Desulfosalsimonadaceae bacterium]